MPKLFLLIYSLGPGGAERVVSVLLPALEKHYHVTLVLMNDTRFYPISQKTNVIYLEHSHPDESGLWKLVKLPVLAWTYARLCQQEEVDVSLSFMARPNYIAILARLFGFRGRVVISERAMPSLQYGYGGMASWINRLLIRTLYPKADAVIANSYGNAADLRENFGITLPIHTLHNPVDMESIRALQGKRVSEYPDRSAFTFITVGRMDAGKNHRLLIDAFAALEAPDARLIIIGDGPLRDELEAHIQNLGMQEQVLLAGRQQNPYAWLIHADCFVFGSNHEGFPNVILEALACGLPVISTDCPSGPKEILAPKGEDDYGLLVPVGDSSMMGEAMRRLYSDSTLREHYANRATIRAQSFALEPFVKKFIDTIETVVNEERE